MFFTAYIILCSVLYVLLLPFLLFIALFNLKYRNSIPARFLLKNKRFDCSVWIHACSFGEINSLAFLKPYLKTKVVVSTITNTGYNRALQIFGDMENVEVRFLPFEIFIPFFMPRNLDKLIVLESELWFMLFYCAKMSGAKTILLNARMSSTSFVRYKRFKFFYKHIFRYIDLVICQMEEHRHRFISLGAVNVIVFLNIKLFSTFSVTKHFNRFDGRLIFAASTHRNEEELVLNAYMDLFDGNDNYRLMIAPRHPERFNEVWSILVGRGVHCAKFSDVGLDYSYNVILVDVLGELINLYNVCDTVILGGSFVKVGGHNPLECAFFHTRLITGPHIFNQHALFDLVGNYKIVNDIDLKSALNNSNLLERSYIRESNSTLDILLQYLGYDGKSI